MLWRVLTRPPPRPRCRHLPRLQRPPGHLRHRSHANPSLLPFLTPITDPATQSDGLLTTSVEPAATPTPPSRAAAMKSLPGNPRNTNLKAVVVPARDSGGLKISYHKV